MKSFALLILLAASRAPFALSSSTSAAQLANGTLESQILKPTSTSTSLEYGSNILSVFDHVGNLFWDRRSPDVIARQVLGSPATFTTSSTNVIVTTVTSISTSTFTPSASAPPAPSASLASPLSSATSTVTKTISGVVIIFSTIVSSQTETGTLPPPSISSATSLTPSSSFICTESICTPSSSAFSWTCSDSTGCGFSTTLASYSCSSGILCTLVPVTTTWSCSNSLIGNICSTAVPLLPVSSSTRISGTSTAPASTPAAMTTAPPEIGCSDASCCPSEWDCNPTSTADVWSRLACPPARVDSLGVATGSWAFNCVPSSLSVFVTETDFLINTNACPPYKTCAFPSTVAFTTLGNAGGTTTTGLPVPIDDIPCSGKVAVCTSVFPSLTQLKEPSCMVGEVPGSTSLCHRCSTMKFPEDCPVIDGTAWPTTGSYFICACSVDSTGRSLNLASGPSGAAPSCAGWNFTSTTEVVGSSTITTSYNPRWATCDQVDVKKDCGTASSCSTMVRYEAESSMITWVVDGKTVTSLIFWWSCKSDLCNAKWWANLINSFCRFVGICHPPTVSGSGFPRPPFPDIPPLPNPAEFTSDPDQKTTPSTSSSSPSSTTSSSSCSANTVTDIIVYCYNTTISGGVFTTGCSTTSSFTTSGCSLSPITTTTTESATCSVGVVTVTDFSVGCFNITDSAGGFTTTCNQTSTYLSTGCSLTPTTSTTIEGAPACSLSPNYNDPAILSDLSIWLSQFPLTLPPDFVNITTITTTPNATLPPSTTSAGWTSIELITTVVKGTNPTNVKTEVVSESVDLWGGVTTVVSGSITKYVSATSTSTLAEATISTITPVPTSPIYSAITTTVTVTTKDILGKTMVVSEVEIIYGIKSSDPSGTSTSVVSSSRISTLGPTSVLPTFSTHFATTSTNSDGKVWSESVAVVDDSTRVVTESTLASAWPGTSCPPFRPANPTSSTAPDTLQCNFDVLNESYETGWANRYVPEGMWWINANEMYKSGGYIDQFCGNVTGPTSPGYLIGLPIGNSPPTGEMVSAPLNYVNSIHRSFSSDKSLYWPTVTFSVSFEPAACSNPKIKSVYLGNTDILQPASMCRQRFGQILSVPDVSEISGQYGCWAHCGADCDAARKGTSSDPVYSSGGSLWIDCLVWTVASIEGDPPTRCPNR